jgi:hypothetical protein
MRLSPSCLTAVGLSQASTKFVCIIFKKIENINNIMQQKVGLTIKIIKNIEK